jgi:succinate-acetate transporter protein
MDGANGQIGGKHHSNTFVLTAFISFGLFNVFLAYGFMTIIDFKVLSFFLNYYLKTIIAPLTM